MSLKNICAGFCETVSDPNFVRTMTQEIAAAANAGAPKPSGM